jgi:Protein of unknown function (DUF992)
MRKLTILGAVTGSTLAAGVSFAQISAEHVQAGTPTCDISGGIGFIIGSQKALNCSFVPTLPGPPEFYSGVINKLGVDLGGTRGGVMVWVVYAPTTRAAGFLAGIYVGASAEVTLGGDFVHRGITQNPAPLAPRSFFDPSWIGGAPDDGGKRAFPLGHIEQPQPQGPTSSVYIALFSGPPSHQVVDGTQVCIDRVPPAAALAIRPGVPNPVEVLPQGFG